LDRKAIEKLLCDPDLTPQELGAHTAKQSVGGGSGIRTHDTVSRIHAFQACALSHSAIPPKLLRSSQYSPARSGDKPALRPRSCVHRHKQKRSIDPPHVARLAHVVTS